MIPDDPAVTGTVMVVETPVRDAACTVAVYDEPADNSHNNRLKLPTPVLPGTTSDFATPPPTALRVTTNWHVRGVGAHVSDTAPGPAGIATGCGAGGAPV